MALQPWRLSRSAGSAHIRSYRVERAEPRTLLAAAGPALALDGVDDYAVAADSASLDLGTADGEDFTIEASFFVPSDLSGDRLHTLVYKQGAFAFFLRLNAAGQDFLFLRVWTTAIDFTTFSSTADIAPGWHHAAAGFDNASGTGGDSFSICLDGTRGSNNSLQFSPGLINTTSAVNVGGLSGINPFYGFLDEVRLSSTVRYPGATYAVPSAPFTADASTRALWHFDETPGATSFADSSGNGNTLSGTNGAQTGVPPTSSLLVNTLSDPSGPAGTLSLRQAIVLANASPDHDTILFAPGLSGTISLAAGELLISDTLTLIGPGPGLLTVSGNHASRSFQITGAATVVEMRGMRIADGMADSGGGILNNSTLTVADSVVSGNVSTGRFQFDDGGGIQNIGVLTLTNTLISANSAGRFGGGGIFNTGTVTATSSTISGNSAGGYGGGILIWDGNVTMRDCVVSGNSSAHGGGGIDNSGSLTLIGSTVLQNSGSTGGGISNNVDDTLSLTNCNVSANTAIAGGGIDNIGNLVLRNTTVTANHASDAGGGIRNSGTFTLTNVVISENSANVNGGAISNVRSGSISGSTIFGNSALRGGGIDTGSLNTVLTITNSTVSGNRARVQGGGIQDVSTAITLTNSVVTANRANANDEVLGSGFGGGISTDTFLTLHNSIVAGNFVGSGVTASDITGPVGGVNNLIGTGGSGGLAHGVNGNLVGIGDPKLGPLADNGGPTPTHALLRGSPAIDAGNNAAAPATDQRGFARVLDGNGDGVATIDIGAFEAPANARPVANLGPVSPGIGGDVTPGWPNYWFKVVYSDDGAIDAATIGAGDVIVTGPGGYSQLGALSNIGSAAGVWTATYRVPAPGGTWNSADNGTYTLSVRPGEVNDAMGLSVLAGTLGTVVVAIPDLAPPSATLAATTLATPGGAVYWFQVAYADDASVNYATIGAGDVLVTGPGGYSQPGTLSNLTFAAGNWTATYRVPAPGGTWDAADNGTYTVAVRAGEVADTAGKFVPAGSIGTFSAAFSDTAPPTAALTAADITTVGAASYWLRVAYSDGAALAYGTVGNGDILVTGPGGYSQSGALSNLAFAGGVWTATYRVAAPGGAWDAADNGTYTVSMNAGQVADTSGNFVPSGTLGMFRVAVPVAATASALVRIQASPPVPEWTHVVRPRRVSPRLAYAGVEAARKWQFPH